MPLTRKSDMLHRTTQKSTKFQAEAKKDISALDKPFVGIQYKLSQKINMDRKWTHFRMKTMQMVRMYKTKKVSKQKNWFEENSPRKMIHHNNGKTFVSFLQNTSAKVYIPNGHIAMTFYKAGKHFRRDVYVIYRDYQESSEISLVQILAMFDDGGNGIVYDEKTNIRLVYNQIECQIFDRKICIPLRFQWRVISPTEKPVYRNIYIEQLLYDQDEKLEAAMKGRAHNANKNSPRERSSRRGIPNSSLDSGDQVLPRDISEKGLMNTMRCVKFKIGKYFSLRITNQESIKLKYRDPRNTIPIELGFCVTFKELTSVYVDPKIVTCKFNQIPPENKQYQTLANIVNKARQMERKGAEKTKRIRGFIDEEVDIARKYLSKGPKHVYQSLPQQ